VSLDPGHEPIDNLPEVPDPPNGGLVAFDTAGVSSLGQVTNAEHPERGHRLSPTADLMAGLTGLNSPARICTGGSDVTPIPPIPRTMQRVSILVTVLMAASAI
jgi:hypothetical protein